MCAGRYGDAALGACRNVDVVRVASGLADELQFRHALGQRARKRRALLRENHRLGILDALGKPCGILFRIVMDDNLMALESLVAFELSKCILIVVDDRYFHGWSSE